MKNGIEVDEDGNTYYWKDGGLHREDGPAVLYLDGDSYWYLNDELHREDGPAIDIYEFEAYFIHGTNITETHFLERKLKRLVE